MSALKDYSEDPRYSPCKAHVLVQNEHQRIVVASAVAILVGL